MDGWMGKWLSRSLVALFIERMSTQKHWNKLYTNTLYQVETGMGLWKSALFEQLSILTTKCCSTNVFAW